MDDSVEDMLAASMRKPPGFGYVNYQGSRFGCVNHQVSGFGFVNHRVSGFGFGF